MKIKIIGTGACGNKATIDVLKEDVLSNEDVLLLNSTLRDIPEPYRKEAILFEDSPGGCGKETAIGAELAYNSLKGEIGERIEKLVDESTDLVVVTASSGGGTGAGSLPEIAGYCTQVIGVPVLCFIFTGFEDDGRELQNTIELFQKLNENYTIQAISNKKFLLGTNNRLKAEKLANDEFVRRIRILTGIDIVDSERNMDEFDLFKSSTTPGFMTMGYIDLPKLKNEDQFNKALISVIDNDKSLDTEKSAKRLGVIINLNEESQEFIDYSFSAIKERLGHPYEIFTHIQYDSEQPEYVSFIASGMKMPMDELNAIYNKYKQESNKVNKGKDDFFEYAAKLRGNDEDAIFDSPIKRGRRNTSNKDDFFSSFSKNNKKSPSVKEDKVSNNINNNVTTKSKLSKY